MSHVELQCPWDGCNYKTPSLEASVAIQMLQMHQAAKHPIVAPAKQEKAQLPTLEVIDGVVTESGMGVFKQRLMSYKRLAGLTSDSPDTVLQGIPLSAYNQLYARYGDNLTSQTEEVLLKNIEQLMIRPENKLSHVLKLQRMRQGDETVQIFSANVRSAARRCGFIVKCGCNAMVSYEDEMVLYQLLSGMNDSSVQADLLAKSNLTLAEAEKYATDKEMAKRSQATMATEELGRIRSTYRRQKQQTPEASCTHCGGTAHQNRAQECPAFGNICACGRRGHFLKCCRNKSRLRRLSRTKEKNEVISEDDAVYELSSKYVSEPARDIIHGIQYDQETKQWTRRSGGKDQRLPVTVSVDRDSLKTLGQLCQIPPSSAEPFLAVADTGATVTCCGPQVLAKLGGAKSLMASSIRLYTANKSPLTVMGSIPVNISCGSPGGESSSLEMLYVVKELEGLYLSKDALISLGCIPRCFPKPPRNDGSESMCAMNFSAGSHNTRAPCGCLLRTATPDPPQLPADVSESSIEELNQILLQHYSSSTFNTCCHQPLPLMHGPPLELALKPGSQPKAVYTPAVVPMHWRDKIKRDLDRDVDMGVLEKVDVNEPVTWCSRMVVTRKHNGEPRRTIDLQALNEASVRQTHPTMPPFQQAMSIPVNQWKTTTDAFNGYHSVSIRECDRHLTTFITPWGRYRYKTTPQGYKASGDAYTHRFDKVTVNVKDCARVIDDTILYKNSIAEMFMHTAEYLSLCGKNGILQNKDKFVFCKRTVDWAGFRIGPKHIHPLPSHTESIRSFPTPQNKTDMRSFLALINQVSSFYATQPKLLPFRALLSSSTPWYWDEVLDQLFQNTRELIANEVEKGIRSFDPKKRTCLLTDWCKTGMGYVMTQKHCTCSGVHPACCPDGWQVCGVGSRFTSAAESRYSPTEGEALAVVNALEKTKYFTLGCDNLIIGTDHKPLIGLFSNRTFENIDNPRLRRLKEKSFGWSFSIVHIPGRMHGGPDALSRYGLQEGSEHSSAIIASDSPANEPLDECPMHHLTTLLAAPIGPDHDAADDDNFSFISDSLQPVDWTTVEVSSSRDPAIRQLIQLTNTNFPMSPEEMPPAIRSFWNIRKDLSTSGNVLLYRSRVVIPANLRDRVLAALHSAHQGVTGMQLRAERSVFWPGMTADIQRKRDRCPSCEKHAPSNPNMPPVTPIIPEYPFQHVSADYFDYNGHTFGVIVDRFSNWFQIWEGSTGSLPLIKVLTNLCRDFGVPETLTSDGGSQFTSKSTQDFMIQHGIHHRLTSVAFPHANCRAEVAVKTAKRLIRDNVTSDGQLDSVRLTRALLQYRNTPDRATKLSPAELLLGRQLRDFIPGTHLTPPLKTFQDLSETWRNVSRWREKALGRRTVNDHERHNAHTRQLPQLSVGQFVAVQNQTGNRPNKWDRRGIIIEVLPYRQYKVMMDGSRRITLRNRKFLRACTPLTPHAVYTQIPQPSFSAPPASTNTSVSNPQTAQSTSQRDTTPVVNNTEATLTPEASLVSEEHYSSSPQPSDMATSTPESNTPSLRRSTRAGRGETTRFKDYIRKFSAHTTT